MYTWLHNYGPHVHNTTCLLTDRWQTDRQMISQTKTRAQTDRQAGGRTDRQVCIRDWEIENLKYQILPSNMMISVHHTVYQSRRDIKFFLPFFSFFIYLIRARVFSLIYHYYEGRFKRSTCTCTKRVQISQKEVQC